MKSAQDILDFVDQWYDSEEKWIKNYSMKDSEGELKATSVSDKGTPQCLCLGASMTWYAWKLFVDHPDMNEADKRQIDIAHKAARDIIIRAIKHKMPTKAQDAMPIVSANDHPHTTFRDIRDIINTAQRIGKEGEAWLS